MLHFDWYAQRKKGPDDPVARFTHARAEQKTKLTKRFVTLRK